MRSGAPGRPRARGPPARRPRPPRGRRAASAASSRSRPSRKPPKPTTTSRASGRAQHQRPRRGEQVDSLGDDQLADERDVAVARSRSSVASARPRPPRRARRRRRRRSTVRPLPVASASASQAAPRPRRAARGGNWSMSTPGGPSRVRAGSAVSSIAPHRLVGGVPRADEHASRARARPSRAYGRKRSGSRLTDVLERAAVDLDRVRDAARRAPRARIDRPHDQVVGQGDVGPRSLARRRGPPRRCASM